MDPKPPKPHHAGHRERLRERALAAGPATLPDYELLELFLFRSMPRQDTKPIAKGLIARFGDLGGVLAAPIADQTTVAGVGEQVALDLKLMHEASVRIGRAPMTRRPAISSASALQSYVRTVLANEPREQFRVLFLDNKNQLILDEVMGQGTVDHAPVYPREVARRALEVSAAAVILVHNHPSGDPKPSDADFQVTRRMKEAGTLLQVELLDHVILGAPRAGDEKNFYSFRDEGHL